MRLGTLLPQPLRNRLADPYGAPRLIARLVMENAPTRWRGYLRAFAFMGATAGATAASAWIMRDVINNVFVERRDDLVIPISLAVLVIFVVKGAAAYGQTVTLQRIGAGVVASVQKRVTEHVLALGVDFYDRMDAGELSTRISHNAASARDLVNVLATSVGRDALTVLALAGVMVTTDAAMAGIALLAGPPAVVGVALLVRRVRGLAQAQFVSLAGLVSTVNELARGVRVVKAYGLEPRVRAEMHDAIEEVERRQVGVAQVNALASPLTETLGGVAVAAVILYAGWRVTVQGSDPGSFFAFLTAFLLAYEPAKRLARLNVYISSRLVGVRLLYELLDTPPSLVDRPGAPALAVREGAVAFEDVRFAYDGVAPALDGLTFRAEPGATTALVGPSGAGKSTVFSLLARFYDAGSGRIAIDGRDVRDVSLASLRASLALVTQESFLFAGTIRENVRAGRPDADAAALERAAEGANLLEVIARLPGGWDAEVGEAGGRLSGGQRQRVAIARAMLRDAPILLLDEATAALDAESEARVQEALARLMRGRTTLVIAHRLATIRGADRIVVMRDGRAVEIGNHASLLAAGGLYRRLHDLQFSPTAGAA